MNGESPKSVPRRGLVLQQPDLMLFLDSVQAEVEFAPLHHRINESDRREIVAKIIERLGLRDFAHETPFSLSRGQRLRTAVGSVLSMSPKVLLLDEPTSGQDREQIERMLDGLAADLDLLIFCTHDVETAARHANRVAVLSEGEILLDGPPRNVLFSDEISGTAAVKPTATQAYSRRLGVQALVVEELVELLREEEGRS